MEMDSFKEIKNMCEVMKGTYEEREPFPTDKPSRNSCKLGKAIIQGWKGSHRIDLFQGRLDFIFNLEEYHFSKLKDTVYMKSGKGSFIPKKEGPYIDVTLTKTGIETVQARHALPHRDDILLTVYPD